MMIISSLLYTKTCHSASIRENCAEIFYFRSRMADNRKAPRPRKPPSPGGTRTRRGAPNENARARRSAHPQGRAKRKRPAVAAGRNCPLRFIALLPSFYAPRKGDRSAAMRRPSAPFYTPRKASTGGKNDETRSFASIRRVKNRRGRALLRSCGRRNRSLPPPPARARCTRCRRCRRSSPPPYRR